MRETVRGSADAFVNAGQTGYTTMTEGFNQAAEQMKDMAQRSANATQKSAANNRIKK